MWSPLIARTAAQHNRWGHLPPFEAADRVAQLLLDFWGAVT